MRHEQPEFGDRSNPDIERTRTSTIRNIERATGGLLGTGFDALRAAGPLMAYTAGNIAGTVMDTANAFRRGLARKDYKNTK